MSFIGAATTTTNTTTPTMTITTNAYHDLHHEDHYHDHPLHLSSPSFYFRYYDRQMRH
jgi:hypothetical protein